MVRFEYSKETADFMFDNDTEESPIKLFVFEKDGRVVAIEMTSNNLNFDDSILKIIG